MKEKNRYFLFSYSYTTGTGNLAISSMEFPSNKHLRNLMSGLSGADVKDIVILGWNEFKSEEDFLNFLG